MNVLLLNYFPETTSHHFVTYGGVIRGTFLWYTSRRSSSWLKLNWAACSCIQLQRDRPATVLITGQAARAWRGNGYAVDLHGRRGNDFSYWILCGFSFSMWTVVGTARNCTFGASGFPVFSTTNDFVNWCHGNVWWTDDVSKTFVNGERHFF